MRAKLCFPFAGISGCTLSSGPDTMLRPFFFFSFALLLSSVYYLRWGLALAYKSVKQAIDIGLLLALGLDLGYLGWEGVFLF